jgi:MFS family permease
MSDGSLASKSSSPQPSSTVVWLICAMAAIGFAFDIYELLMLPLIIKPAIAALSAPLVQSLVDGGMPQAEAAALWAPGGKTYVSWARTLFFLPALIGGVFGLLGGYLTDWFGRRRVLTGSILLYAFSAMAAGFSTDLYQLLFFRCLVFIGVCVEFVAAVAWLAELFDDPHQREKVLGYTQAFSSVGGLLVGLAFGIAAWMAQRQILPAIYGQHEAWRYTLISGVIPALPLIFIRPFLPESPKWQQKKLAGQLKRPSLLELFSPQLIRTTIVTTIMFAASYGIAFGAIQQLPQILNGHVAIVKDAEKQAAVQAERIATETGKPVPPGKLKGITGGLRDEEIAKVTIWQEVGGLVGRFALAALALLIVSRRNLLRVFQIPALIFVPLLFYWISTAIKADDSLLGIKIGVFIAGFFTVAQFSFWGNYIPRVFPLHLRGTGESFAANIGGRILGTAAAWLTLTFSTADPPQPGKIALVGAIVAGSYALVGVLLSFILPEPKADLENE